MKNNGLMLEHEALGWKVEHDEHGLGPSRLEVDGVLVMDGYANVIDGKGRNGEFSVRKSHVYRKSGIGIFESECALPSGVENGFWQACRYGANVCRVTTDFQVKSGTLLKEPVECGSMRLHGKWVSLTTVPGFGTQELKAGDSFVLEQLPLVCLFQREDGFVFEIDSGFDTWRWNYGLGFGNAFAEITVDENGLDFKRFLVKPEPGLTDETALQPEAREFRFCSQFAWSAKSTRESIDPANVTKLEVLPRGKGVKCEDLGGTGVVGIDLAELEAAESSRAFSGNLMKDELCWECNAYKQYAKKAIRQLAAKSSTGKLVILGGLVPSICDKGKHVDRPGKTIPHWDLNGIVTFSQWARQSLGPGWNVQVQLPEPWDQLPSLQGLFETNGFES